jgi:recombination protein RecT
MQTLREAATGQRQRTPYEGLKHQLEISQGEFYPLLGHSEDNVKKFVRIVLNAALANPALIDADRKTFIASCMRAAQDGLLPDGREAVLNIYSTKVKKPGGGEMWVNAVQYLPMVAGYIKALYAHPDVAMVDAAAVYEKDRFTFQRGDDPKLVHEPYMGDDAGGVICAYVVVKLKSGEIKREVMPRRDIEKVRGASKSGSGENSPWVKWYDQQAIKSVIKRAAKQLPKTNQFEKIDHNDNEALGFTATPQTLGDLVAGGGQPSLQHNPSETLDGMQGFGNQAAYEHVDAGGQHQEEQQQRAAEPAPPAPAATKRPSRAKVPTPAPEPQVGGAEPPPPTGGGASEANAEEGPKITYAVLADRIQKCRDKDTALLILDEARILPGDQQKDLERIFDQQFPSE